MKSMWIDNATVSLSEYRPDDLEHFGLWIEFRAGPENEVGADDFRLFVCTPAWLRDECASKMAVWGQRMLIVSGFDIRVIKGAIAELVENCAAEAWPLVARKIAKFAAWEFEDFPPQEV